jgi:hypothetical protein
MSNTETKVCKKCGVEKGVGEYYVKIKKSRNREKVYKYYDTYCKKCSSRDSSNRLKKKYHNDIDYKEKYIKRTLNYVENNLEKVKVRRKIYGEKYRLDGREKMFSKKQVDEMTDRYIKSVLCSYSTTLQLSDIPQELIELKRKQLKLKRDAKKAKENNCK